MKRLKIHVIGWVIAISFYSALGVDIFLICNRELFASPLVEYVRASDVEKVSQSVSETGNLNRHYNHGNTLLHMATSPEIIRMLIKHGADVNAINDVDNTPLHLAAYLGDIDKVKILIDSGADVNKTGDSGNQPINMTSTWHSLSDGYSDAGIEEQHGLRMHHMIPEVIQLLVTHGADVNVKGRRNQTPLCAAVSDRDVLLVEIFLECGAKIDVQGSNPFSILEDRKNKDGFSGSYTDKDKAIEQLLIQWQNNVGQESPT